MSEGLFPYVIGLKELPKQEITGEKMTYIPSTINIDKIVQDYFKNRK